MNIPLSETTVIIPTYNDKFEDLKKAITSVINQSLLPKEIIVIDDGSTIPTAENVIKSLIIPNNLQIKLFKKENGGPSSARNLGIQNSQGKYISFLDSDDEMLPDNLLEKENILSQLPIDYFGIYGSHIKNPSNLIHKYDDFDGIPKIDNIEKTNGIPGGAPSYLFRKSALDKINGFDINLTHNEDFDLIIRLILAKMKCKGNFKPIFIRNFRPNSITRNNNYSYIYKNILNFLNKASMLNYFSKKELNLRYKSNEIFYAKNLILNEKKIKLGFIHFNKAFNYSNPSNLKQTLAFILTKFYWIFFKNP
ncbi:MAG: glycosyltransferase family A protein [Advenella sp.]